MSDCKFCGAEWSDGFGDIIYTGDEDGFFECSYCGAYSLSAHAQTKDEARHAAFSNWSRFQMQGEGPLKP